MIPNLKIWAAGGLVLAGLGIAVWVQTARLGAANEARKAAETVAAQWQANYTTAQAQAEENARVAREAEADRKRIEAEAKKARQINEALRTDYDAIRRNTRNVAPSENGPVAPVLCATLDGLRRIEGGTGPVCRSAD